MNRPPPLPPAPPPLPNAPPVFAVVAIQSSDTAAAIDWKSRASSGFRKLNDLPWPLKILLLLIVPAIFVFGPTFIGIAGFFGAVGMPLLLPVFVLALAIIGLITLVTSIRSKPKSAAYFVSVIERIAQDEALRRMRKDLREAMTAAPAEPKKQTFATDELELRRVLLNMDCFAFERHVMTFFQDKGLVAWVTQKSNDAGVDGFAKHPNGLIVVQCKRNGADRAVGRPVVQQFKGVVEENGAWRGYVVTTSYFTPGAIESAGLNDKLRLVDLDCIVNWHKYGVQL